MAILLGRNAFAAAIFWLAGGMITLWAVPPEVEKGFAEKYPDEAAEKWEQDAHGYWEAKFLKDEIKYRADFEEDGIWVETENSIEFEELPVAVQAAIKKEYPHEEISEIEAVDNASRGEFFDVEFKRPGKNRDVEYRATGERVESSEMANFPWPTLMNAAPHRQINAEELGPKEILFELGYNLLTILIYAWGIYYLRHRDHQMCFLLLGFNLFLFPIILVSTGFTAGAGFTIFAMLALVRLRSDSFSKTEVAYLLGAVALTFINALLTIRVSIPGAAIVLLTAWLGDHPRIWRAAYHRVDIRYPIEDRSKALDRDFLRNQLSEEFQIDVDNIEIEAVHATEVRLVVIYRDRPGTQNEGRRMIGE